MDNESNKCYAFYVLISIYSEMYEHKSTRIKKKGGGTYIVGLNNVKPQIRFFKIMCISSGNFNSSLYFIQRTIGICIFWYNVQVALWCFWMNGRIVQHGPYVLNVVGNNKSLLQLGIGVIDVCIVFIVCLINRFLLFNITIIEKWIVWFLLLVFTSSGNNLLISFSWLFFFFWQLLIFWEHFNITCRLTRWHSSFVQLQWYQSTKSNVYIYLFILQNIDMSIYSFCIKTWSLKLYFIWVFVLRSKVLYLRIKNDAWKEICEIIPLTSLSLSSYSISRVK